VQYGFGKTAEIGAITKPYGKKALIVTGRSSAKKSGLYDRVKTSLEAAGLQTLLYDQAKPNPLTTDAVAGAHIAKENGCDVVVALGGGSVIDCAKGIAFCAVNGDDIDEYIYGRKSSDLALPVIAVPTTCGTGSEGNGFAVLTNPANGDKKSLRCASIAPKAAIVDPENMMTMPKEVLASVGYDALCHLMEAYTANNAEPLTDALCLYAMPLIVKNLPAAYADPSDKEAWGKLAIAATIGGMVIGQAGVTLAHAMEHPLSGLKNIVHGRGLAVLSPYVIEATYRKNRYKFGNIGRILGGMTAEDAAPLLRAFSDGLGLENNLTALGFNEKDIPWLVENCQKVSAGNLKNTPGGADAALIQSIYEKAM
ncbi:MAG: iron-containing alcohol dehydrogenase, partial [Lachnospiraceae bacterium]